MKNKIVIIGAGEIGSALKFLLDKAGKSEVQMWDQDETKVSGQRSFSEIIPGTDAVFLGIPSRAVRSCVSNFKQYLDKKTIVISLAKGVEERSLKTMDEILRDEVGAKRAALLFGPMIAEELRAGKSGAAVLASRSKTALKKISLGFNREDLRIEFSKDTKGVALAGVLKNIYSLGLGIIHGLELGTNYRGWYVGQACFEMTEIIKQLKGKKETVYGPAGIGDLVATGFSRDSKNHQVGKELALIGKTSLRSEGSESLPRICELLNGRTGKFILLNALREIFIASKKVGNYFPDVIGE